MATAKPSANDRNKPTTTSGTNTELPPKYGEKVTAYMTAAVLAVAKNAGDCEKMADAFDKVSNRHGAAITMLRTHRTNPAVRKWTVEQSSLAEQGRKMGRSLNKCAKHPSMRTVLRRITGTKKP